MTAPTYSPKLCASIRELQAKATKGDWQQGGDHYGLETVCAADGEIFIADCGPNDDPMSEANSAFIAAAHQMADQITALEALVAEQRKYMRHKHDCELNAHAIMGNCTCGLYALTPGAER